MNIHDFNIHFSLLGSVDKPHLVSDETRMSPDDLLISFNEQVELFKGSFCSANFMLFNQHLFSHQQDVSLFLNHILNTFPGSTFSALFDFRNLQVFEDLENAFAQGVRGIKFHSYFQKISKEDYASALNVSIRAQELGMFVCIDTSFGTSGMYRYDNMKLACLLSDKLTCPIILLHSGGMRILEAMLLADEKSHVYLETSFSLPFYIGSSIEQDIIYAYSKLGSNKLLYGSDHPYIDLQISIDTTLSCFSKCKFSSTDVENIMLNNALIFHR
jgi:uncharacterized protein